MRHAGRRISRPAPSPDEKRHGSFIRQFTVSTGYIALGFLGLTLLLGLANLLLGRRNPVSNYLRRDVGTWTAIFSVVHVISALLAHVSPASGLISSFLHFFVAPDGGLLTNRFGLGNWTGLAALVIVVGLLATSSDAALRILKTRLWKRFRRLNYALFVLVILHAFFYGALLRVISYPFYAPARPQRCRGHRRTGGGHLPVAEVLSNSSQVRVERQLASRYSVSGQEEDSGRE